MHILDLIMYFIILFMICVLLGNNEYNTKEDDLFDIFIIAIYTGIYCTLFLFMDYNWIDILKTIRL